MFIRNNLLISVAIMVPLWAQDPRLPGETDDAFHARVAIEMRNTLAGMPLGEIQYQTFLANDSVALYQACRQTRHWWKFWSKCRKPKL